MNSAQAMKWLEQRNVAEIDKLLADWSTAVTTLDSSVRYIAVVRGGTMFAAELKGNAVDATLAAMALAIAAGEMEIESVTGSQARTPPADRPAGMCDASAEDQYGVRHACFRGRHDDSTHENALSPWFIDNGLAVRGRKEIDAIKTGRTQNLVAPTCTYALDEQNGPRRACFRVEGHQGDHEDALGFWRPRGDGSVLRT